jgi:hypothetical protein
LHKQRNEQLLNKNLTSFEFLVSFQQFEGYRRGTSVTIIDVREPEELLSEGQIPRATNIPMNQVSFPLSKKLTFSLKN